MNKLVSGKKVRVPWDLSWDKISFRDDIITIHIFKSPKDD